MKPQLNLVVHSALIYILCFMVNTGVHEGAHAVAAKLTGLHPILHHNYVSTSGEDSASLFVKVLTPAAGPLMSLLQGILFLLLLRTSPRKSLTTLFYLWMSVMGFINIGGYLMLTPLVDYGDTGRVFTLFGSPQWLKWIIAFAGLFGLIKLVLQFTRDFENQIPAAFLHQSFKPGRLANLLIAYPVLIGIPLTTLISLPAPTFISILYPTTSPFIIFMVYGRLRRKKEHLVGHADYPENISIILAVFTIGIFVITRLLVKGIPL
ncbi:MAG TPA: M50 family metallopeptidase [Cyclobacteriaceae bacterium]|nr:M50 family metallopeptidase [Cyclobacteriaceae bacterium]